MANRPTHQHQAQEEKVALLRKRPTGESQPTHTPLPQQSDNALATLQNQVGNAAVQRLLAQRSSEGPTELDDETAGRINRARGGQALEGAVQQQMGTQMGYDFGNVRVHTSGESHALNEQLNAKAFTTGQDIFFRNGAYNPHSSGGQELIAHELTHVVQQSSGAVAGGSKMQVNAPGDRFEQEADRVAAQVGALESTTAIQRQTPEEDELMAQTAQRQELEEDEVQMAEMPEEDEELIQQQALDEDELATE